ncbi:hypothetical protein GN244_ATG02855 [Phytophthora infestans]|uniref:Uncharacterized protein n=1 Tax=Phytophthora infestans TaxID=4787 RepID=A0A833TAQ9_PHYIN|nr:hypothetical protein GN244_ATG02855 [Phytophthora infestans]KAF4133205.1 hypothetical protein GN958_ATG17600 [Phytophthora infestans]KAF4148556.1 hypothetical protein GN958_ATG02255 [Phytophthora infestans]
MVGQPGRTTEEVETPATEEIWQRKLDELCFAMAKASPYDWCELSTASNEAQYSTESVLIANMKQVDLAHVTYLGSRRFGITM